MRVLVISDQHAPFTHRKALDHLRRVRDEYKIDSVVNIGDVSDSYFATRFQKDPLASTKWEIAKAQRQITALWNEFPAQLVCIGNHDERVARRCEEAGVPGQFLKEYADVWNTPGWEWGESFMLDGVEYLHGNKWSGMMAPRRMALEKGRRVVMGHIHKFAGIQYIHQKGKRKQLLGMNVGCLIDEGSYAFAYGKSEAIAGVLGCGVVLDGHPIFVPMK